MIQLLLLCVGLVSVLNAREFLYPVAAQTDNQTTKVLLLHQKSVDHLELLMWDPVTKITTKGLLSTFTPAAIKMLPDNNGFSFIDKDRVLLKSFGKRSPKTIAFHDPVDDLTLLEWLDPKHFCFMGKGAHHYEIYQSDLYGSLNKLLALPDTDFLYPQVMDSSLYVITRNEQGYAFASSPYPQMVYRDAHDKEQSYQERIASLLHRTAHEEPLLAPIKTLLNLGEKPAAFLTMITPQQGFYIEHPATIDRESAVVSFTYCKLENTAQGWQRTPLFDFALPTHFFTPNQEFRLYESFLPLLPRVINDKIYFMHCYDTNRLLTGIFAYNNGVTEPVSFQEDATHLIPGYAYFSPLAVKSFVFYGGTLLSEDLGNGNLLPTMWINDEGMLCVDLPCTVQCDVHPCIV